MTNKLIKFITLDVLTALLISDILLMYTHFGSNTFTSFAIFGAAVVVCLLIISIGVCKKQNSLLADIIPICFCAFVVAIIGFDFINGDLSYDKIIKGQFEQLVKKESLIPLFFLALISSISLFFQKKNFLPRIIFKYLGLYAFTLSFSMVSSFNETIFFNGYYEAFILFFMISEIFIKHSRVNQNDIEKSPKGNIIFIIALIMITVFVILEKSYCYSFMLLLFICKNPFYIMFCIAASALFICCDNILTTKKRTDSYFILSFTGMMVILNRQDDLIIKLNYLPQTAWLFITSAVIAIPFIIAGYKTIKSENNLSNSFNSPYSPLAVSLAITFSELMLTIVTQKIIYNGALDIYKLVLGLAAVFIFVALLCYKGDLLQRTVAWQMMLLVILVFSIGFSIHIHLLYIFCFIILSTSLWWLYVREKTENEHYAGYSAIKTAGCILFSLLCIV